MLRFLQIAFLFTLTTTVAQEEIVYSVYFDFDKYKLDNKQGEAAVDFVKNIEAKRIESIQIYGYCDDRGKDTYNFKLSSHRAMMIKSKLTESGVTSKIIVTIEGKGRIMIDDDVLEDLPEVRSKNRRVDVVLNLKPLPKIEISGVYKEIKSKHTVGDRIYLENILFDRGSSLLSIQSKNELDKVVNALVKNKKIHIEIQGHVCCTPQLQKEAIDRATKKRELSVNRAKAVYQYLIFKKIDKSRLTFKGYGNTLSLGRETQYDRRVELVIKKI
jgi:outer membrane protein OmpA-like peptidoglycan-associated protein